MRVAQIGAKFLARMLLERRTPRPARVDEPLQRPPGLDGAAAVITFIGHATFLIQTATGNILTDPVYSERAGPLNVPDRSESGSQPCRYLRRHRLIRGRLSL